MEKNKEYESIRFCFDPDYEKKITYPNPIIDLDGDVFMSDLSSHPNRHNEPIFILSDKEKSTTSTFIKPTEKIHKN